jgi:hypothetical protein
MPLAGMSVPFADELLSGRASPDSFFGKERTDPFFRA